MSRITRSIFKKLRLPRPNSHKGQNGRLLVIAGNEKYHGPLLYTIKAASRVVDLIYVLTTAENQELVRKLKSKTAEFIPMSHSKPGSESSVPLRGISRRERFRLGGRNDTRPDCVLIGPGMGVSKQTHQLVERVLKSKAKAVLDADALNVLDGKLFKLLGGRHILTPHFGELKRLSKKFTIVKNLDRFVKLARCTIVRKGRVDVVINPTQGRKLNYTGNEGMTKGGTGDVLAGLIAALFCKNEAYISAAAGVFVNGLAGDELYKKVGPYYDAEDLVEQVPKVLWKLTKP